VIEIVSNQGVIDLTPMLGATPTAVDLEAEVALAAAARDGALAAKADAELAQAAAEAAAAEATEISGIDTLDEGNAALIDNETSLTRQRLSEGFVALNSTYADMEYEDGDLVSWTQNGVPCSATYNPDGTVATLTTGDLTRTFTYDADGNLIGAA
jgi:YD repeat-containing protein